MLWLLVLPARWGGNVYIFTCFAAWLAIALALVTRTVLALFWSFQSFQVAVFHHPYVDVLLPITYDMCSHVEPQGR